MRLKNILADLSVYGRSFARSREGLFFTFVFPIVLIAIFGAIFSGNGGSSVPLYVQNMDGNSPAAQQLLAGLNSTHLVSIRFVPSDANITRYVSENSITAALVIPSTFGQSITSGAPVSLPFYNNPTVSSSQIAGQAIGIVVQQINLNLSNAHNTIYVRSYADSVVAQGYIDFLIPGLIGFTILTTPMFSVTFIVSNYKKDKIFRQLSLTPLTRGEWLFSKFLWYIIVSVLSAALMIGVGVLLFDARVTINLYLAPLLLIGVFMFVSLGTFAGAVAKTEEGAAVIGNIITFPMMFLSGTFFPISIMPVWLQTVAHFLPLYYVIDGLNAVMVYTNYASANLDILISLAISIAFFILAMLAFSWKEA